MSNEPTIFPFEAVAHGTEKYFQQYSNRTRIIYITLVILMLIIFALLFIIKVDISVRSSGLIKPTVERTEIRSAVDAVVDSVLITDNATVTAGDILVTLRSRSVDDQQNLLGTQQDELMVQEADLKKLLAGKTDSLLSSIYSEQYGFYSQRRNEARTRLAVSQKNLDRYSKLYKQKVVAAVEFEQYQLERNSIANELALIESQQKTIWQNDLTRISQQLESMGVKDRLLTEEKDLYVIRAPMNGSIQDLKGITKGSIVSPNEILGEISPDGAMVAETYVTTKDIGLIKEGGSARIQVDAFNYNDWGMINGKVISVSNDVSVMDGIPVFKVKMSLDKHTMKLKNGYEGKLKKGMTIQARYIVTRRTLFQLLYDNIDDWLGPNNS